MRERAERVGRFRDLIVKRAEELCELLVKETGKTRPEALSMEVMVVADLADLLRQARAAASSRPSRSRCTC